jgi:predicted naringenin-chalcone synthase
LANTYINRIATAVPPHDVHRAFLAFGHLMFRGDTRRATLFDRMAERSGIEHRYSYLAPEGDAEGICVNAHDFYRPGEFPRTAERMKLFERFAPALAERAVEKLELGAEAGRITHLIVTSCTGFSAPGIDLELVARCGLPGSVERTMIGFMGCYAAINGLKLARHIVRSEPGARVLALNLELCSLHLRETADLDEILSFLLFGDGCAAALITAEPIGVAMESFRAVLVPGTRELIQWSVRDFGFDMVLSGQVPGVIHNAMRAAGAEILGGQSPAGIALWAVHPGGRTVLDAVERAFGLDESALAVSREVLRRYGNMSSGTVMFVLDRLMRSGAKGAGCAMAFGPGLMAETMLFRTA